MIVGDTCINGVSSYAVLASMCDDYTVGDDGVRESHVVYLGAQAHCVMSDDDEVLGDAQTLADYNRLLTLRDGQTLILGADEGMRPVFLAVDAAVVPVPATAWLLGSTMGLLDIARRQLVSGRPP